MSERLGMPTSISDVATVLKESNKNLSYLCSNAHKKINKWSRYKPVVLTAGSKDDVFNNTVKMWDEKLQSVSVGGWPKAWFYGKRDNPVFVIPTISDYSDIGKDGIMNKALVWLYNPPSHGTYGPYRLSDFAGYNHNASPPVVVSMSDRVAINVPFYAHFAELDTDKYSGEFMLRDVCIALFGSETVYFAITIYNRTRNVTVSYSNPLTVMESSGLRFALNPQSSSSIASGGFGHQVRVGDIIEIYTYLTYLPGETQLDSIQKFSAALNTTDITYRKFTVQREFRVIDVKYNVTDLRADIADLGKTFYVNDYDYGGDGNIFKTTKLLRSLYGKVLLKRTTNSDYTQFKIVVASAEAVGRRPDGTPFATKMSPTVTYYSGNTGSFNIQDVRFNLDGAPEMKIVVYNTFLDANMQRNGVTIYGCPIYDSVEYNYVDSEDVGIIVRGNVGVYCNATSSLIYTYLTFTSTDGENILPIS